MNDYVELSAIIHKETCYGDADSCRYHEGPCGNAAHAALLAGYRKPRTITTIEEAAALPEGTVIRTIEQGYVFELAETIRNKAYGYSFGEEPGSFINDSYLPATVLYVPEEQS